jgi:catechol 2,3-dioxygenase-like lactoylglutathione lyase family enzyme
VFDHVTIRVSDREASERFYDTVLPTVGLEKAHSGEHFAEWGDFSLAQATQDSGPGTGTTARLASGPEENPGFSETSAVMAAAGRQ